MSSFWEDVEQPFSFFEFLAECPDIVVPKNMQEIPEFVIALREAGHFTIAEMFADWNSRLEESIIQETTIIERVREDA